MTARTERRTDAQYEANRRTVNQSRNARNEGGFSRSDWEALDRNERKRLAQEARNRLDDGTDRDGDEVLARVFDRHCQWDAFVPPEPLCRHGNTVRCNTCFVDYDRAVDRSADV